jgi:hypothetical protein
MDVRPCGSSGSRLESLLLFLFLVPPGTPCNRCSGCSALRVTVRIPLSREVSVPSPHVPHFSQDGTPTVRFSPFSNKGAVRRFQRASVREVFPVSLYPTQGVTAWFEVRGCRSVSRMANPIFVRQRGREKARLDSQLARSDVAVRVAASRWMEARVRWEATPRPRVPRG